MAQNTTQPKFLCHNSSKESALSKQKTTAKSTPTQQSWKPKWRPAEDYSDLHNHRRLLFPTKRKHNTRTYPIDSNQATTPQLKIIEICTTQTSRDRWSSAKTTQRTIPCTALQLIRNHHHYCENWIFTPTALQTPTMDKILFYGIQVNNL